MSANRGTLVGASDTLTAPAAHLYLKFGEWAVGKEGGYSKQRFSPEDAKIIRDSFHDQQLIKTQGRQSVPIYAGFPSVGGTKSHDPAAPAVGWADDFVIENNGVRLPVKWGKRGQEILRDGSFKFYAPLWVVKNASGVFRPFKLLAIGLLNNPQAMAEINAAANDTKALSPEERTAAMQRAVEIEMARLDPQLSYQYKYEVAWRRAAKTYYPDFF